MSYDVYVGGDSYNYTSNMRRFFDDMGAHPISWVGRDRKEVGREIGEALRKIARLVKSNGGWSTLKMTYDAKNGWGDVEGATRFLIYIWSACFEEIPDTVDVWY